MDPDGILDPTEDKKKPDGEKIERCSCESSAKLLELMEFLPKHNSVFLKIRLVLIFNHLQRHDYHNSNNFLLIHVFTDFLKRGVNN